MKRNEARSPRSSDPVEEADLCAQLWHRGGAVGGPRRSGGALGWLSAGAGDSQGWGIGCRRGGRAAQDNPTAHPEELVGAMLPKQEGRAGERGAAEKLGEGSLRRPPEGAGPVLQARGLSEDLRRAVTQPGTEWDGRSGL